MSAKTMTMAQLLATPDYRAHVVIAKIPLDNFIKSYENGHNVIITDKPNSNLPSSSSSSLFVASATASASLSAVQNNVATSTATTPVVVDNKQTNSSSLAIANKSQSTEDNSLDFLKVNGLYIGLALGGLVLIILLKKV